MQVGKMPIPVGKMPIPVGKMPIPVGEKTVKGDLKKTPESPTVPRLEGQEERAE